MVRKWFSFHLSFEKDAYNSVNNLALTETSIEPSCDQTDTITPNRTKLGDFSVAMSIITPFIRLLDASPRIANNMSIPKAVVTVPLTNKECSFR